MGEAKLIRNMQDLCDTFYADEPSILNKRIYEGTDCGASISVYLENTAEDDDTPEGYELVYSSGDVPNVRGIHNGDPAWRELTMDTQVHSFSIQTIVEGSDATVDSEQFVLPVDKDEVWKFMEYMEAEASRLWEVANTTLMEAYYLEDGEPVDLAAFKRAASESGFNVEGLELEEVGGGYFRTSMFYDDEIVSELIVSDFEDESGDAFTVNWVPEDVV